MLNLKQRRKQGCSLSHEQQLLLLPCLIELIAYIAAKRLYKPLSVQKLINKPFLSHEHLRTPRTSYSQSASPATNPRVTAPPPQRTTIQPSQQLPATPTSNLSSHQPAITPNQTSPPPTNTPINSKLNLIPHYTKM